MPNDRNRDLELALSPEIERRIDRLVDEKTEDIEKRVRLQVAKELGMVDAAGDVTLYEFKIFWKKQKAAEKRLSQFIGGVGIAMLTSFAIFVVPWLAKAILAKLGITLGAPTP